MKWSPEANLKGNTTRVVAGIVRAVLPVLGAMPKSGTLTSHDIPLPSGREDRRRRRVVHTEYVENTVPGRVPLEECNFNLGLHAVRVGIQKAKLVTLRRKWRPDRRDLPKYSVRSDRGFGAAVGLSIAPLVARTPEQPYMPPMITITKNGQTFGGPDRKTAAAQQASRLALAGIVVSGIGLLCPDLANRLPSLDRAERLYGDWQKLGHEIPQAEDGEPFWVPTLHALDTYAMSKTAESGMLNLSPMGFGAGRTKEAVWLGVTGLYAGTPEEVAYWDEHPSPNGD